MKKEEEEDGEEEEVEGKGEAVYQSPTESYGAFATVWRPGRLRKR